MRRRPTPRAAPSRRTGHCDTFHAEDEPYWDDVYYWTTATEECIDGRTDVQCVPYTEWVNAWNELRS